MNRPFPWKTATAALFLLAVSLSLAFAAQRLFRRVPETPGVSSPSSRLPPDTDGPMTGLDARSAIPEALEPPKDQVLSFSLRAEGVQIYECRAKDDGTGWEWALVAPDATLFDDLGEKAGTHYAGPSWEAKGGSKVVAVKQAAVSVSGSRAVPWLLLRVRSHEGIGAFSKVTYIQRVDTWAGMPPARGGNRENAGKQVRIKYAATYRFFVPMPTK